eukprot:TRINITY_DN20349_c0_g1_i1.p1 TRINITY_DN20349_c0_g1~~TRINITY_DN20349_c0_g1_i1.p1  ORF type:complete len:106 (-),score=17.03 TRINITY_DN20349_c0_g1_i1:57-374(-)
MSETDGTLEVYKKRWILTADDDSRSLYRLMRVRSYRYCGAVVHPYVVCISDNNITPWNCSGELRRMKECLHAYFEEHHEEIEDEWKHCDAFQKAKIEAEIKKSKG